MGSDDNRLLGTWKLLSYTRVDGETGKQSHPLGPHPLGYLTYSPDGRMMGMMFGDNRPAPSGSVPLDGEAIAPFRTMVAYAGTYVVDGIRVTHSIDASWNEAWTGTEQIRFYELDGTVLTLTTAPARSPLGAPVGVATLVWQRVEPPRSTGR
jgi:lipocalin-like protein